MIVCIYIYIYVYTVFIRRCIPILPKLNKLPKNIKIIAKSEDCKENTGLKTLNVKTPQPFVFSNTEFIHKGRSWGGYFLILAARPSPWPSKS